MMSGIKGLARHARAGMGRWLARRIRNAVVSRVRRYPAAPAGQGKVHVVAFYGRTNGISQGALLQAAALEQCGYATDRIDVGAGIYNPFARAEAPAHDGAIICHADGQQLAIGLNVADASMGRAARIGYCAWEQAEPPIAWGSFDRAFQEIWTPSRFCADAFAPMTTRPVRVVPHVVAPPAHAGGAEMRVSLGIDPEAVVALAMCDIRSGLARKNPLGAIEAMQLACQQPGKQVTLIVKLTAPGKRRDLVEELQARTAGIRTVFVERHLDDSGKWALIDAADILVSLHRAEGFGLPMLEAMALGKAVVATGWSGNLDFMDDSNAALVDYDLIPIDDPQGFYRNGSWANPRISHAAGLIRRLVDHDDWRCAMGERALRGASHTSQLARFDAAVARSILGPLKRNAGTC